MSARPNGRSSALETASDCTVGTATLAAMNTSTTASIPKPNSFWRTQERHGRW